MAEKIYLHLLILCGILCQEIIPALSDDNTKESSNLLVREKRVVSRLPEDRVILLIEEANYVVNIKEYNRAVCAGAILSHHTVITAAPCARHQESVYTVHSGAIYDRRSNYHNVTSKITYYGNPPEESIDGIALMNVNPPFVFSSTTGKINLFVGLLSAGTQVNVYGFGCHYPLQPRNSLTPKLRCITLPILNHGECQNIYRSRFAISAKHLCTYHEQKYCCHKDIGAPLVVNDRLAGVHVWKGEYCDQKNPDVFVNLLRSDYSEWIRDHIIAV